MDSEILCSICSKCKYQEKGFRKGNDAASVCDLNQHDLELIKFRAECPDLHFICSEHKNYFLSAFESKQKACCDPFHKHKKRIVKGLKPISLSLAKNRKNIGLIPGKKLCISCRKEVIRASSKSDSDISIKDDSDVDYEPSESIIEKLNESCDLINCSPLKVSKRKINERSTYLKNKSRRIAEKFTDLASKALNIEEQSSYENEQDLEEKCKDCKNLMEKLREKFYVSNISEKLQILTLVPESWSIQQTLIFFKSTEYLVKKSRKILQDDGILGKPGKKKGHTLPDNIIKNVMLHYYDDDISRISSNSRDVISVPTEDGKRELKPKRLILHDLKSVYLAFKETYPDDKIGFSKFCELRPKQCITVSSRGIHCVCVCTYHQNVKLMVQSIHLNVPYHELLQKIVCDLQSEECMLHRCPECPSTINLREYLLQLEFFQIRDEVTFKQWLYTDRCMLETFVKTVDEFIDTLVNKLDSLTQHHFIAKSQSAHLKAVKQNLAKNECVILVDFSENFTCIVQDAVQGFHWQNIQATVHPVVVYFKKDEDLESLSMCFISDCLKHDTSTFFAMQKITIKYILKKITQVTHAIYFSDGCAAQYKNYKNFVNLCHHKQDHGITAEWNFFATSHGKNACDGVGGTIKRLATRASLQRTTDNQILNAQDLYKFASENIKGIKSFYVDTNEIHKYTKFLEERYAKAKTVPGTRENHYFQPLNESTLLIKRVSSSLVSFKSILEK